MQGSTKMPDHINIPYEEGVILVLMYYGFCLSGGGKMFNFRL